MRLAIWLIQAAVAGPPAPSPSPAARVPFAPAAACGEAGPDGEIVVCGRRDQPYRLPRIDPTRYAERPVRAETGLIGNARIAAETEQGQLPGGQIAKRAMVRIKVPF